MNWSFLTGTHVSVSKRGRVLESRGRGWPGGLALTLLIGGALVGIVAVTISPGRGSGIGISGAPFIWMAVLTAAVLLLITNFKTLALWKLRIDCESGRFELVGRWGLLSMVRSGHQ